MSLRNGIEGMGEEGLQDGGKVKEVLRDLLSVGFVQLKETLLITGALRWCEHVIHGKAVMVISTWYI